MEPVNKKFLEKLKKGGRIFKYKSRNKGDDYVLYTVEKKTGMNNIELMNAFDEQEKIIKINAAEIIKEGCWFFNPSF